MFARHNLAWLSAEGWRQVLAAAAADHVQAITAWQRADWPLVVRRADVDQAPGEVALGLALPPRPDDGRKLRIPCRVHASGVWHCAAPLPLAQLVAQPVANLVTQPVGQPVGQPIGKPAGQPTAQPIAQAIGQPVAQPIGQPVAQLAAHLTAHSANIPRPWRSALASLAADAAGQGIALHVYGSAALQVLTGQGYLRDTSDIDLLVQPRDRAQLDVALALLCSHANALPLDGEIVFPGGRAVAWKEWAAACRGAAGTRVLVKEMEGVSLVRPDVLLATLEEATCLN